MRAPSAASSATGLDGLGSLRATAAQDPKAAIKEAARQFEALFMQELVKSMRATTMASGMMDNGTTEMATGMLDTQYATQLSGRPGGLADAIARQLERQMGGNVQPASQAVPMAPRVAAAAAPAAGSPTRQFVQQHQAAAERVAAESGIPAGFMLGQAAHETGWGRRNITGADGTVSNNLFGIKAGANWKGPVVEATTTEVINGQAMKVKARFRAYASSEESFRDYARLISSSPRYAGVMQARGDAQSFAQNLQRAGYATDPHYAAKLSRVIDSTLKVMT